MTTQHILLTGLGTCASETTYQLGQARAVGMLTPLALIQLLPLESRPNRVLALVTHGAKQPQENQGLGENGRPTWELFAEGVRNTLKIEAECIDIPDGRNETEIRQIIESAAEKFTSEGIELTLDVTQGFRHFPFITYALALYLTSLRGVRLRGAYYGLIEGFAPSSPEPRPIVDLQLLLELPEWFHAVRVFSDTGSSGLLATLLAPLVNELRSGAQTAGNTADLHKIASFARNIRDQLHQFAFAYEAAIPLELGKAASLLSNTLQGLPPAVSNRLPLSPQLAAFVLNTLTPLKFSTSPTWKGEWKARISLEESELHRQASLIEHYFDRNQLPLAAGLLREWVISWVLFRQGKNTEWWSRNKRLPAERQLGALAAALNSDLKGKLSDQQKAWAEFWNQLSDLRNTLHHHGMRQQALESAPPTVCLIRTFWNRIVAQEVELPSLGGGCGTLLITPIGNRPGVLYSALLSSHPDRVLILCSEQSESMIDEAVRQSGFSGPIERIVVVDPHGGFDDLKRVRSEAGDCLLHADQIVANLTGGTTLMGLMVQQLVESGSRLSRPFRRFALIDRRSPAQQDSEPWVQSDHCWIDDSQGENDADH